MTRLVSLADESIALQLVKDAVKHPFVAIDTETNGQDIRDGRGYAQGLSLAYGDTALYLPFRHSNLPQQNYDLHRFLPDLQWIIDSCTVIYHNAKFDKESLRTLGLTTSGRKFVDTMVLAHLVHEVKPFGGKGLDTLVKYYEAGEGKKESDQYLTAVATLGYENLTAALTCEYAMNDAWITLQLYNKLVPKLKEENLGEVWIHKMDFIELLIDMERKGVLIDTDLCERMASEGHHQMALLRSQLNMLNPASTNHLEILLLDQLELPVVKRTPTGKPGFNKEAMEIYEAMMENDPKLKGNETAQKILAYRGWQKSTSSNYEPYVTLLSPDGRLRCNYNLHRARTGRMTCDNPNLQQIPKTNTKPWNGKMKQCFIPQEGYVLVEGDYSQLEFRLSSAFAKQQSLLEAFNDPTRDVFDEVAEKLGIERDDAKRRTYAVLYGAGARRMAAVCGTDISGGELIRNDFFNSYPNLRRATRYASDYGRAKGKVPFWSGRNLHPDKIGGYHKVFNNLVQGGCADIVERTMLRAHNDGFNTDDCRMLLAVHDSIVWEVREDLVSKLLPAMQECMENIQPDFGVKFKASFHYWGEKKDIDMEKLSA